MNYMWCGIAIFTFFGTKTCKSQKIVVPLQGERQKMYRHAISILVLWLLSASLYAEDSLPIIEVKADRTMIYPQRMDLNGEETSQVLLMGLFVYFVAFPMLGRNYDAAVLCAGMCGFGLGATPNAMANMSAVCYKYRYTVKPFLIVPIIGAMFADLINTAIITLFLNLL